MRLIHLLWGVLILALAFLAFGLGYFLSNNSSNIETILPSNATSTAFEIQNKPEGVFGLGHATGVAEVLTEETEMTTSTDLALGKVKGAESSKDMDDLDMNIDTSLASIVGNWELEAVLINGEAVSVPVGYVIHIRPSLFFGGEATCNTIFGQFVGDIPNVKINNFGHTKKACPGDSFEQEWFNILASIRAVRITEKGFDMLSGENTIVKMKR